MPRNKKLYALIAACAAIAIGAAAITVTTTMAGGGDDNEQAITGEALDRASAAALAHTGGGSVAETEVGDGESLYEVEVTLDSGDSVDVQLDEAFNIVGSEPDSDDAEDEGADEDGDENEGEDAAVDDVDDADESGADDGAEDAAEGEDVPITGDPLAQASAAALAFTGGGRVTDTEVGDEESYYEIEVTMDDGTQIDVQLDEQFNVVGSETEGGGEDDD